MACLKMEGILKWKGFKLQGLLYLYWVSYSVLLQDQLIIKPNYSDLYLHQDDDNALSIGL